MRLIAQKVLKAILGSIVMTSASLANANPVSFKDGWGIMPTYSSDWSDVQVNYSVTNRYSLGLSYYHREGEDSTADFYIAQYNYLLKRWNELDSQTNIYLSTGAGGRSDSEDSDAPAGYAAFEADYETRRIYTLIGFETLQSPSDIDSTRLRYRLGFAPYLAPIDAVHSWLIIQYDYMPEMEESVALTPLVRLFYNNFALETGVSMKGEALFALMAHF